MLEVLMTAYERFGSLRYLDLAREIADGLKGVGGGQGAFEPASSFRFSTTAGNGGVERIESGPQRVRSIRLDLLERNTPFGYSLFEIAVYGPGEQKLVPVAAVASSVEGPGLEAGNAIDGNLATRWGSEHGPQPQFIEPDLGEVREVERVDLVWEAVSARTYTLRYDPLYVPDDADGYLLRPWFRWSDPGEEPLSHPWDPGPQHQ